MNDFWEYIFLGNSVENWMYAFGGLIIGLGIIRGIKFLVNGYLTRRAKRTASNVDDFVLRIIVRSIIPILYLLVFYIAFNYLEFSAKADKAVRVGLFIAVVYFVMLIVTNSIKYLVYSVLDKKDVQKVRKKQVKGVLLIFNIIVWIIGIVFLLSNLGFDVKTMLTGLGVGGIAVALAAQSVLSDLLSYFTILFDKPFEVGDYISVGDESGTVEYIGLKTTRVRTLSGEQLVCSNKDITDSRLHNYGRMDVRRVVFSLQLVLQTSSDNLKSVPRLVKEIIVQQEDVRFDRGHFIGFDNSRLNFEFVYYLLKPDFLLYRNTHQQILFTIFDKFEQEGLAMAYPTSSVYLYPKGEDKKSLEK